MCREYNVAAVISGRGSTFLAFLEACRAGNQPGVVPRLLISTNYEAAGLKRAADAGFPLEDMLVMKKAEFPTSEARGEKILEECDKRRIHLIANMGGLMIFPPNVHKNFLTINSHPAMIPTFGGLDGKNVHQAVINFVRLIQRPFVTQPVVHRVTEKLDGGPILGARCIRVRPEDTPDSLDERVIKVEHELMQTTIYLLSQGAVSPIEPHEDSIVWPGEEEHLAEAMAAAKAGRSIPLH